MKILIVHEVDWLKKVTYEIHHLSEIFSLSGHKVIAIDVADPGKISLNKINYNTVNDYHRVYDNASITLFRTPLIPIKGLSRISAYFLSYKFIKKILKENKIDIVLLYSVVTNSKATIKACKELNIPIIHKTLDVVHDLVREKFLRKYVYNIEKYIYPKFDKVLCHTPFMKKWVEEMGSLNAEVIHQGVDSEIMKPLPVNKDLRNKLGINEKDKIVMYLGTVYSFSGLDVIIDKIPEILEKIPEFKLLIVGGGPDLDFFQKRAKTNNVENKVIFTNFVPYLQVPRYCSLAKLFINPFRINEVTKKLSPVKIFDLLSCGKPVIATPLDGLLYDFPIDSKILTYSQLEDFDEKIVSLLQNNSLETMGDMGREFVIKNFAWNKVAEKILNDFSNMIKN